MKIAVCIKRVPDTAARIKVGSSGIGIDRSGIDYCTSPYDEIAVERAVLFKEAGTAAEVVVYCLAPAEATKEIRTALAMGADRAIHLVGDPEAYDAAATAAALASAIEPDSDLVMVGNKAADLDSGQVGARIAARLDRPFVNQVSGLEIDGETATLTRIVEGASEKLSASLPMVVGTQKGLAEPRYPALKGIMAAKKKPIDTREAAAAEALQVKVLEMSLPQERAEGKIVGEGKEAVPALIDLLRQEAKVL